MDVAYTELWRIRGRGTVDDRVVGMRGRPPGEMTRLSAVQNQWSSYADVCALAGVYNKHLSSDSRVAICDLSHTILAQTQSHDFRGEADFDAALLNVSRDPAQIVSVLSARRGARASIDELRKPAIRVKVVQERDGRTWVDILEERYLHARAW